MIRVVPEFYPAFHCTASACRHSCCVGWEVDVDEDTLAQYRQVSGPFGRRLAAGISAGASPHFRLDAQERCPFLNGDNLCDIILTLGEGALCQICADHPRFRNWFPDWVEEGLGLCCEEAARLLLTCRHPVRFLSGDWPGEELEAGEEYLSLLRQRDRVLECLQNRGKPLQSRICEVFSLHGVQPRSQPFERDLELLLSLEILEPGWRSALEGLQSISRSGWDGAMEQDGEHLLVYLVYRYYLSWGLERGDQEFPLRFGLFSLRLLAALRQMTLEETGELTLADRVEWLRRWSAELEYSEENLERLAEYFLYL